MYIIENPITLEKLEVANKDFAIPMDFEDAIRACNALGRGWRMPTIEELKLIYKQLHKEGKGNFQEQDNYWSSSESDGFNGYFFIGLEIRLRAWFFSFLHGDTIECRCGEYQCICGQCWFQYDYKVDSPKYLVRAVRDASLGKRILGIPHKDGRPLRLIIDHPITGAKLEIANEDITKVENLGKDLSDVMKLLLSLRADAKSNKDFKTADKINDELIKLNFTVKDSNGETSWIKGPKMDINNAFGVCKEINKELLVSFDNPPWRLPTIEELKAIYEQLHLKGRGNFQNDLYWSCSMYGEYSPYYAPNFWGQIDFNNGEECYGDTGDDEYGNNFSVYHDPAFVRLVRTF
jgi:hypothetical protein